MQVTNDVEDDLLNDLNLEEIDFDEDIPIEGDLNSDEECEGLIFEENEMEDIENWSDDSETEEDSDLEQNVVDIVFVDDEGIQHVNDDYYESMPKRKPRNEENIPKEQAKFQCKTCSKKYKKEPAFKRHESICKLN